MKQILFFAALILTTFLAAAEPQQRIDFTGNNEYEQNWQQLTSNYYQPLGKVKQTMDGLLLTGHPKNLVFVTQNEGFTVCEGDQVEFTITLTSSTGGTCYLSLFQYGVRRWLTNATTSFFMAKGDQTVTKVLTIKKANEPVVKATLACGVAEGRQALVKSISYRFLKKNYMPALKPDLPPGLILRLDGSNVRSLVQENGNVVLWRDLSGQGNDVKLQQGAPKVLKKGINNLSCVRFSGKEWFKSIRNLPADKGLAVFLVFQRTFESVGGDEWQDSLYWGKDIPDHTATYHLTMGRNKGEEKPKIFNNVKKITVNNPLIVGCNAGKEGFLWGDVAEILVFNRADFAIEDINKIRNYLLKKWNIQEQDYVRLGPLPPAPKHVSQQLPLSDQQNKGKWRLIPEYSDEFDGNQLDRTKWTDQVHYSLGGEPVRVLPDNLKIKDGMAQITTIYDPNMPSGRRTPRGPEFHSFSTGGLYSVFMPRYGYFEARTKLQPTTFNNNFWLIGAGIEKATGKRLVPEVDIYEIGAKSFSSTYCYNMCLHLVQHQPTWMHKSFGGCWISNFKFYEDFHVYGLEWTPKVFRYFIDGALVREFHIDHNWWDVPMTVQFNTNAHFDWFGVPNAEDFPCTYYIDYFRFWKNPDTDLPNDWDKKYKIVHRRVTEGFAYDYYKKHGRNIVMDKKAAPAPKTSHDLIDMNQTACSAWKASNEGKATFIADVTAGKPGMRLTFPPMLSRKNSGEVQYAAPFNLWPKVELTEPVLKITDWKSYTYLAVDFHNPRKGIEALTIVIDTEKGRQQQPMLLKSGAGVYYWKLPPAIRNHKIKKLTFNVRGTDRPILVDILKLRLEK